MRRLALVPLLLSAAMLLEPEVARTQQPQGQPTPQVSLATRKEVFDFVRSYVDAHNRADATALSDAISRRLDVTSVNDGTITRGWDAIRAGTDQITGKEGTFRFDVGTMDFVSLGSPTHVLVLAPTTVTVNTQQGVRQVHGAMTLVLEKGADGWKILNEHYSTTGFHVLEPISCVLV